MGRPRPPGLTLDAGALIGLKEGDVRVRALVIWAWDLEAEAVIRRQDPALTIVAV